MTNREHVIRHWGRAYPWPHVALLDECWSRDAEPFVDIAHWIATYRLHNGYYR